MRRIAIALALAAVTALCQSGYQKPPKAVLDVLRAPDAPAVLLSPARTHILLLDVVQNPSISDIARPMLRLAGRRIDPGSNGPHLTSYATAVTVKDLASGKETKLTLPAVARLFSPTWSLDGKSVAVANQTASGTELWVADAATGQTRKLNIALNAVMSDFMAWLPDGKRLIVSSIPAGRGAAPERPLTPPGPKIQETEGKAGPTRTYQDMLTSPYDEALFEYYAKSQLLLVDAASGKATPLGTAGLYDDISASPSGGHYLVTEYRRPFSYLLPVQLFTRDVTVRDLTGKVAYTAASLPMSDRIPIDGVPVGPRSVQWRPGKPATLVWVEALDGGNPKEKVPHRDRILMLSLPDKGEPSELAKVEHRLQGAGFGSPSITWLDDGRLMVSDYDRMRRWSRTFLVDPAKPAGMTELFSRNVQDRYKDPGAPVADTRPDGRVVAVRGDSIFLRGAGASPKGDFPFVDRYSLATGKAERIFQSDPEKFQEVVGVLDDTGSRLLIRSQSPLEPPNLYIREASGKLTPITNNPDPSPQLRGIHKELVTYTRADGVNLSFTLYLPPGYKKGTRLPTVVWAYPLEYNDADTAGQIAGSQKRFNRLSGYSHLFFLLEGYAILDGATMPVVGDPETVNNTYVEQIVASAQAAIDKAVEMGVTDRNRVGVGGHSYGAFMTANLLAHSDLFRAGIARSGAYNRTLTPFGFQSERRTLWEAPSAYLKMSPFMSADKIKEPILLIHGEADNNQGTFPIQSDRMYQALRGNGATVRLVSLPHESHGYSAQETIEHVLFEQLQWFDKYVKNAPALTSLRD